MVAVAQQKLSKHGIGASEIAAICGLHPYASPWDVYLAKIGAGPDKLETEPMEWGLRLETAIRQKYCDETGYSVRVPGESMFHPIRSWARATPDGIAFDKAKSSEHLVQIKNVGTWFERSWSDAPPTYIQLQTQWEMDVAALDRDDVACLIGGNEYRCYTIHRDYKVIDDLVTIAEDFWRKVEKRIEPKVDDSDACRQHFEKRLKRDAIELIADEQIEDLFEDWHEVTLRQKHDKKRIETIRNEVRKVMAESGATIIHSKYGDAKLSIPAPPVTSSVVNWKHVAELLGSTKCTPEEFAELVQSATSTLTPEPKAPTLYAPKNWSKENH